MATPENEKRTPVFDWITGEFKTDLQGRVVTVTEAEAVAQIVLKAQQTVRGVYLIYGNMEEPELDHTYGSDAENVLQAGDISEDVRIDELKRAAEESVLYDPWILAVEDIEIKRRKDLTGQEGFLLPATDHIDVDEVYASFTVQHIFGSTRIEGVNITDG